MKGKKWVKTLCVDCPLGVDTRITLNIRSRVGGVVRVKRKKKIELQIFSGDIHFPGEIDKIFRHSGILIPPGKTNSKELKNLKFFLTPKVKQPTEPHEYD